MRPPTHKKQAFRNPHVFVLRFVVILFRSDSNLKTFGSNEKHAILHWLGLWLGLLHWLGLLLKLGLLLNGRWHGAGRANKVSQL